MSNSTTPNEQPVYPPCGNLYPVPCWCGSCAVETDRIDVAFYGAEAAARAEEARLRTYLKDCDCPCCEARRRLRAISYDRAEHSPAEIHCETSDRRDYPSDPATLVFGSDEERLAADAAAAEREYRAEDLKAIRADLEDE